MSRVVVFERIRIVENLGGLAETNAMLLQIGDGFFIVPLEPHLTILPYSSFYECTATRGSSLPSPPSAGVSTLSGAGHSTSGTERGP